MSAPGAPPFDDASRRLRLAVVIGDKPLPRWVHETLGTLVNHPRVEVRLVASGAKPKRTSLLHGLFRSLDQRRVATHSATMQDVRFTVHGDAFQRATLSEIDPDMIWQVEPLHAELSAPFGVWRYEFDSGLDLIDDGRGEGSAQLLADMNGQTLRLGTAHVRAHPTSPAITEFDLRLAAQRLLRDAIDRVLANAWTPDDFAKQHESTTPVRARSVGNLRLVCFLLTRLIPRLRQARAVRHQRTEWTLGIAPRQADGSINITRTTWMPPPSNSFVADPFVRQHDGLLYLFVEELPFAAGKGHISVTRWHPQLGFDMLEPVLNDSHHLSFPFLFEHDGALFMMPECHESGQVRCFECTEFPHRWTEREPIMKDMRCVDAVLLQHDGRWWLFLSRATGQIADDNLYAFHADSPWGTWTPHTMNPVRTGLRGSRMAGGFFRDASGRLVRPAQDCSKAYGGAVVLFAVEELSPHTFRETEITAINPKSFPAPLNERCHTFQQAGEWIVFDACRTTPASQA